MRGLVFWQLGVGVACLLALVVVWLIGALGVGVYSAAWG
jgi:hypothetical protein